MASKALSCKVKDEGALLLYWWPCSFPLLSGALKQSYFFLLRRVSSDVLQDNSFKISDQMLAWQLPLEKAGIECLLQL